jgi:transposase
MHKSKWSVNDKYAIVIESLKADTTIQAICNKYGISQTTYYKWRDKFLEGAKENLANGRGNSKSAIDQSRVEELEKLVGKKSLEIEILKKTLKLI